MVEKGYIDRELAFDMITDLAGMATTKAAYAAIWKSAKQLNKVPTADVAPVKHGHWTEINHSENFGDYHFVCSECKCNTPDRAYVVAPDFCPNCGAKMDGVREND